MRDLWNLFRGNQPRLADVRSAFEMAGLTLDRQPIPWCAESVLVHASVDMPYNQEGRPADFELRVGGQNLAPEAFHFETVDHTAHMRFRLAPPAKSLTAEVFWKKRTLGQTALPVIGAEEYAQRVHVTMPTVSARQGDQTVACQTYVTTQCQGWIASAVLQSELSLAPLMDLGLDVEVRPDRGAASTPIPVLLTSSQLQAKQALVSVSLKKPRGAGSWTVAWRLRGDTIAERKIRAVSKQQFLRSLKVVGSRFVVQREKGDLSVVPFLKDFDGVRRVGPCFLIVSSEPGMAGRCVLQMRVQTRKGGGPPVLQEHELLVTDGPTPFAPGTLEVDDLRHVTQFELRCGRGTLATLPLGPTPIASFTAEGGFALPESFQWSAAADEELKDRLGKLLQS